MSLDVFISADLEGISGWVDGDESDQETRAAMVGDVNAAIEGVLEAEPDSSVIVADSHADKLTIPPADLHESASLIRGGPRPAGMVDGASEANDVAFFVGYHDLPGSGGFSEHTFTGTITDVRLNGRSVGEFELNALVLADRGVPVALVSGDERLGETVADLLPDAAFVTAKAARSSAAARCRHPKAVREDIREAAAAVAADPPTAANSPVPADPPLSVAVDYMRPDYATVAALWPGVEKAEDSRTVEYEAADVPTAYQFVRAATKIDP